MTTQRANQNLAAARTYHLVCFGADGGEKWRDEIHNLTTDQGLDFINDTVFGGSSYTASWHVGLTSSAPSFAAGHTMSSHSGWTEITDYSEADRPTLTMSTSSGGVCDSTANKADFSINAAATVGGAFIASSNVKGGTAGTLLGGGALGGGDRTLADGDTLQIDITSTITSA